MLSVNQELIVDRAKHPLHAGRLSEPTVAGRGANAFCGDEVELEAQVEDGTIMAMAHQCRACSICSASADFLAEYAIGKPLSEVLKLTPEEIQAMLDIPLSPVRLKCALLALETLRAAEPIQYC